MKSCLPSELFAHVLSSRILIIHSSIRKVSSGYTSSDGASTGYFQSRDIPIETKFVDIGVCTRSYISNLILQRASTLDHSPRSPAYASHRDHILAAQSINTVLSFTYLRCQPAHSTASPARSPGRQWLCTYLFVWVSVQTVCRPWMDRAGATSRCQILCESAYSSYDRCRPSQLV
jgi:hypothetical protein